MSVQDAVRTLIEPQLAAVGLVVDEVAVTAAGQRRQVKVTVESALPQQDAATTTALPTLTLDEVTDATRVIDEALDSSDVMGSHPYVLEVSSPGVGRTLTTAEHFRRNVTRLMTIGLSDGRTLTGRLTSADDSAVTVVEPATKKTPERVHDLALSQITGAKVQVEFNRPDAEPTDQPIREHDAETGAATASETEED